MRRSRLYRAIAASTTMRRRPFLIRLVPVCLVVLGVAAQPDAPAAESAPSVSLGRVHEGFFKASCLKCHAKDEAEQLGGGVRLDDLPYELTTVEAASRWQKVLAVLNAGEMPPKDEPRPDETAKTNLLSELSTALVKARKSIGDQGRVGVIRRLNRREYVATIRDLLGIETAAEGLPEDNTGSYDTIGAALYMSSDQIDNYLAVGRGVVAAALAEMKLTEKPPEKRRIRIQPERERPLRSQLAEQAKLVHEHQSRLDAFEIWRRAGESPSHLPAGLGSVEAAREAFEALRRPSEKYFAAARDVARPRAFEGRYLHPTPRGDMDDGNTFPEQYPWIALPAGVPPGAYVVRVKAAVADDPTSQLRFIELCSARPEKLLTRELGTLEHVDGFSYNTWGNWAAGPTEITAVGCHDVTGSLDPNASPQILEFPVVNRAGVPRHYLVREKTHADWRYDHQFLRQEDDAFIQNGVNLRVMPAIWVDWIEWEGPIQNKEVADRSLHIFGSGMPEEADPAAVRSILERFATRAFRGVKPSPSFLDRLVKLQEAERKAGGDFMASLVEPMAVILASPRFLYLHDPAGVAVRSQVGAAKPAAAAAPPEAADRGSSDRLLSDLELASRLSYFLWGGPPDDKLIAAAQSGDLRKPQVLAAQVDRMIADPRAIAFSKGFVSQWLGLDRIDFVTFNFRLYPQFDESTRKAAKEEVWQTFHTLLKENLDARKLLKADFVVINSLLADHYDVRRQADGRLLTGLEFRKVPLPDDSPRGGLLGMACILAMGSNGTSSSPVERGAWVLRKLLNDPPPPAPANVPQLARLEGKPLTARQRLMAHQEESQCKQCHRKIDSIGFGLENFDASGLWREVDTFRPGAFLKRNAVTGALPVDPDKPNNGQLYRIDASGELFGGPSFRNYFELREVIAARGDDFLRGLVENLHEYALGRPTSFGDTEAIDGLLAEAKKEGAGLKGVVKRLVALPEFQNR